MISHCYLIHGGEPLQTEEIIAQITHQAAKGGYNKKVVFEVTAFFNWDELLNKCQNLDLFADRTLLEIRLHSDTVNKQGTQVLEQVLSLQDPNHCIIIRAPKLKTQTLNSHWAKHIQKHGKVHVAKALSVQMWPVWITKRLNSAGFNPTSETVSLIASCYAGNLLACAQFIQKLSMVLPAGKLEVAQIREFIDVNNQFSIFELSNYVLQGDALQCVAICHSLQSEGTDPILVLWAITRDIRNLLVLKQDLEQGAHFEQSAQKLGIWRDNLPRIKAALDRMTIATLNHLLHMAHNVDLICKGMQPGNAWDMLITICLVLTGKKMFSNLEELNL